MPPKSSTLLLDLFATHHQSGQLVELGVADSGISADDFALLSFLGRFGPSTPTDVARELGLYLTTTLFRVGKLEERRYVVREPNPQDGRSFVLSLTARGEAKWREARVDVLRLLRRVEKRLGDPESVRATLNELRAALDAAVAEEEARKVSGGGLARHPARQTKRR
jgi:DNA-binding MarR family transcriptional regulator